MDDMKTSAATAQEEMRRRSMAEAGALKALEGRNFESYDEKQRTYDIAVFAAYHALEMARNEHHDYYELANDALKKAFDMHTIAPMRMVIPRTTE